VVEVDARSERRMRILDMLMGPPSFAKSDDEKALTVWPECPAEHFTIPAKAGALKSIRTCTRSGIKAIYAYLKQSTSFPEGDDAPEQQKCFGKVAWWESWQKQAPGGDSKMEPAEVREMWNGFIKSAKIEGPLGSLFPAMKNTWYDEYYVCGSAAMVSQQSSLWSDWKDMKKYEAGGAVRLLVMRVTYANQAAFEKARDNAVTAATAAAPPATDLDALGNRLRAKWADKIWASDKIRDGEAKAGAMRYLKKAFLTFDHYNTFCWVDIDALGTAE